jgi:hypothetical protein
MKNKKEAINKPVMVARVEIRKFFMIENRLNI